MSGIIFNKSNKLNFKYINSNFEKKFENVNFKTIVKSGPLSQYYVK